MPSTTDFDNFTGRVKYAASCFMRGVRNSRSFDSCFEMYDGGIVVTALVRRCQKKTKNYATPLLPLMVGHSHQNGVQWQRIISFAVQESLQHWLNINERSNRPEVNINLRNGNSKLRMQHHDQSSKSGAA